MKKKSTFRKIVVVCFIPTIICLFCSLVFASTTPTLNQGKKWRIGYYEGGGYSEYTQTMKTLIEGLMGLGWIDKSPLPEVVGDTVKPYWSWLSKHPDDFLSFEAGDAYSADWDSKKRGKIKSELLQKLKNGSLDLVIAMGTWAGQDLANNHHSVPTVVLSTSDPVKAGIIKSAENSGLDHVTARIDPTRYLRQLRMFHRIVGFKKLGVAYEDTPEGRIYSALDEIEQVAAERGFAVVKCTVLETNVEEEIADASCRQCYHQLSEKTDAIYVTALTCVDRRIEEYVGIFNGRKIPTFSMIGSPLVKKGLLLSVSSDSGYKHQGTYNAKKIASILNGAKPRELSQTQADPLDISINMKTKRAINFPVPKSLLRVAKEIYD